MYYVYISIDGLSYIVIDESKLLLIDIHLLISKLM